MDSDSAGVTMGDDVPMRPVARNAERKEEDLSDTRPR
jgi:hypothetical protein